jgi:hypothetical protein
MMAKLTQNRLGVDHYLDENGVHTEEGINAALDDVRQIWQERVDGASVSSKPLKLSRKVDSDLRRSHLGMGLFLSNTASGRQGTSSLTQTRLGDRKTNDTVLQTVIFVTLPLRTKRK